MHLYKDKDVVHDIRMKKIVFISLTVFLLNSCTSGIIKKSRGVDVADNPEDFTSKIKSAQMITITRNEWSARRYLSICYQVKNRKNADEKEIQLRVNISNPEWDSPNYYKYEKINSSLAYYPGYRDIYKTCGLLDYEREHEDRVSTVPVPVINVIDNKNIEIPEGYQQVVYVKYKNSLVVANGYASSKPFYGGQHSIGINIPEKLIYTKNINKKPYLLLLTPATVVVDAVAGVTVSGFLVAVCIGPKLFSEKEPCK